MNLKLIVSMFHVTLMMFKVMFATEPPDLQRFIIIVMVHFCLCATDLAALPLYLTSPQIHIGVGAGVGTAAAFLR